MVVILKSLVPGCLFNIIGFGSTFKSLFTSSQNYEEVKELCAALTHVLTRAGSSQLFGKAFKTLGTESCFPKFEKTNQ